MTGETTVWRSWCQHRADAFAAVRVAEADWVQGMEPADRSRMGIYASEAEAVERAIRDNQRLARKVATQIAALKVRKAELKDAAPTAEGRGGEQGE